MDTIRAVCFDAFGTIVEITDKRRTFQGLINNIYTDIAIRAMTRPIDLRTALKHLDPSPKEEEIVSWEADIAAECASIKLRPGIKSIWATLKRAQLKIAVCSNLAAPYAMPMFDALPDELDGVVLSYRVGLMKPHKEIYSLVASLEVVADTLCGRSDRGGCVLTKGCGRSCHAHRRVRDILWLRTFHLCAAEHR